MVKKFMHKKSKRQTCHMKYKIQKKVREHNRKLKKKAKTSDRSKKRKDPGVPNSLPFKDEVMKDIAAFKDKKEAEIEQKRQKKARDKIVSKARNLDGLVDNASQRLKEFDKKEAFMQAQTKESKDVVENSLKTYYREFNKVIEAADVIFEVLDARDPMASRCVQVEQTVLDCGPSKRLVLILNKIDLIPKTNVEKWLKYLRKSFPTIAFKSCIQSQKRNLAQSKQYFAEISEMELQSGTKCVGASTVMKLLGNYRRHRGGTNASITVGVVGFPNTGKSSVINSLRRAKSCATGPIAGMTKVMQTIQLEKNIRLLDSPGVVFNTSSSSSETQVLHNCVRVDKVDDAIPFVDIILKRCDKKALMMHYNLSEFDGTEDFLEKLALRSGKLKKGGLPDINSVSKSVINHWNTGKIKYYTEPPESDGVANGIFVDAKIVAEMSAEFNIESFSTDKDLQSLPSNPQLTRAAMCVESAGPCGGLITEVEVEMDDVENGDGEIETEKEEALSKTVKVPVSASCKKKYTMETDENVAKKSVTFRKKLEDTSELTERLLDNVKNDNLRQNKVIKASIKKLKKKRKKEDILASKLSTNLLAGLEGIGSTKIVKKNSMTKNDNYNFEDDFVMK